MYEAISSMGEERLDHCYLQDLAPATIITIYDKRVAGGAFPPRSAAKHPHLQVGMQRLRMTESYDKVVSESSATFPKIKKLHVIREYYISLILFMMWILINL